MHMAKDNSLELMVKVESIKCDNWSDFEHSSLLPSSKSHNLII